jgi:hypothetical protein
LAKQEIKRDEASLKNASDKVEVLKKRLEMLRNIYLNTAGI